MEVIFKCDIPLCYDSTIHKICLCQKKKLYLDNRIYVRYRTTCSDLGYVILKFNSILKKHTLKMTK
jgi:hypothetical protein